MTILNIINIVITFKHCNITVENSGDYGLAQEFARVNRYPKSTNSNLCIGIMESSSSNFLTYVASEKFIRMADETGLKVPVAFLV